MNFFPFSCLVVAVVSSLVVGLKGHRFRKAVSPQSIAKFWDETNSYVSHRFARKIIPYSIATNYRYNESSQSNYGSTINYNNISKYKDIRNNEIDYEYHAYYIPSRVQWQDKLIDIFLQASTFTQCIYHDLGKLRPRNDRWIIFMAGAMNAGKTFVLKKLQNEQLIPEIVNMEHRCDIVDISADLIRPLMPEWSFYQTQQNNDTNNQWISHFSNEIGLISEILLWQSFILNKNILFESSLRYTDWFENVLFPKIQTRFTNYKIAIIAVRPPNLQSLLFHVQQLELNNDGSALTTMRKTKMDPAVIQASLHQSNRSIQVLQPFTHVTIIITNTRDANHAMGFEFICSNYSTRSDLTRLIRLRHENVSNQFSLLNWCHRD